MQKRTLYSALIVAIVLAALMFVIALSGRTLSSHHASINVYLSENDSREQRLLLYDKVIETMKTWAEDSDMYLVTDSDDKGNLSSFTSNPDADMRECIFRDKLSSKGPMPLQVMSSYDANGSMQVVRIMFAQGYSKEPSERLKQISSDLYARLIKINEETNYSIW